MSLRFALLALLNITPQTGYDLAQRFTSSVRYVWNASHSQVYPELRKLEREGLIEATEIKRGEHATKREYGLTPAGCAAIEEWVDRVTPPPAERSTPHLHAMYLEYASFATARRHFRSHLEHYASLKAGWEQHAAMVAARATDLMHVRLAKTRPEAHDALVAYKVHVYEGLIARAQTEIEWAERGLEMVDQLEATSALGPGERLTSPVPTRGMEDEENPRPGAA